jgi:hypothetical protein
VVSYPYLPTTLNTLNDTKENRIKDQQDRNPEPLRAFPVIKPPLLDRPWSRVIKILLQGNKSIVPELKMVDLPLLELELAAFHSAKIKSKLSVLLSELLSRLLVMSWRE